MTTAVPILCLTAALLCLAGCGASPARRGSVVSPAIPAPVSLTVNNSSQPYTCVKVRDSAIKIDGDPSDRAWRDAAPMTSFTIADDHVTTARRTTVARLLWSDKHLFFSAECGVDAINAVVTLHNGAVYNEETAEIFLCPLGAEKPYYEFEFNPIGGIYDSRVYDHREELADRYRQEWANAYGAGIRSATRVLRDEHGRVTGWTLEAAIPMEDLRGPEQPPVKAGDTWPLNIYRNAIAADGTLEQSHWKSVEFSFHDPLHFGRMVFTEKR